MVKRMNLHDSTEQAYMNGYHKGKAYAEESVAKEIAELETKCHQLEKERDALLADVSDYQGSICCYCKNIVRAKGVEPSCRVFGEFPITNGLLMSCGRWEWRGVKDA